MKLKKSVCLHQFSILGGAGGKGTWGKLGCELELPWIDPNDPNYESDSEKAESPKAINGKSNVDLKALVPEMSEEDVRKAVEPLILEYFENSDSMEVLFTLQEMLPNLGKCSVKMKYIFPIFRNHIFKKRISIHEMYMLISRGKK